MSVTQSCRVNHDAVTIKLAAGQKLRHTITDDPEVVFSLVDEEGQILLETARPARVYVWPESGASAEKSEYRHSLAVQFGVTSELTWLIELLSATGQVLRIIKDCTYANVGPPDEYFDALEIFVEA